MENVEWLRSIILTIIAALPGLLALFMRNKTIKARAEAVAAETTTSQFDLLYQEARLQVHDCRKECASLKEELKESQAREVVLEDKVEILEKRIENLEEENAYLKTLLRRLGGTP